jgi:hypothetical protein
MCNKERRTRLNDINQCRNPKFFMEEDLAKTSNRNNNMLCEETEA